MDFHGEKGHLFFGGGLVEFLEGTLTPKNGKRGTTGQQSRGLIPTQAQGNGIEDLRGLPCGRPAQQWPGQISRGVGSHPW